MEIYKFDRTGTLRSPSINENQITYPYGITCNWHLNQTSASNFVLSFTRFNIDGTTGTCSTDYLKVISDTFKSLSEYLSSDQ